MISQFMLVDTVMAVLHKKLLMSSVDSSSPLTLIAFIYVW